MILESFSSLNAAVLPGWEGLAKPHAVLVAHREHGRGEAAAGRPARHDQLHHSARLVGGTCSRHHQVCSDPRAWRAGGRGVLALADLRACLCCRDAGDELLLTVLRCPSVSAPSSALTAPFGTGEGWLDWRVGCERLAKAMRVPRASSAVTHTLGGGLGRAGSGSSKPLVWGRAGLWQGLQGEILLR